MSRRVLAVTCLTMAVCADEGPGIGRKQRLRLGHSTNSKLHLLRFFFYQFKFRSLISLKSFSRSYSIDSQLHTCT